MTHSDPHFKQTVSEQEFSIEAIEDEIRQMQQHQEPPTQTSESDSNPANQESISPKMKELRAQLDEIVDKDLKLAKTIEAMEQALAQTGNPDFKSFWEARTACLEQFKDTLSPPVKALYWAKYRELTKEAKRLKEILEEQTAFAIEQIEIAIHALEQDAAQISELTQSLNYPEFPRGIRALQVHFQKYLDMQRELNLLNAQAARINALRKELIKTEMRIRQKNKFFQRLSSVGDHVFPRRKDLIKELSRLFTSDVEEFTHSHFGKLENEKSLHHLREEIKSLQQVAKLLTLNTTAFNQTRLKLSECWDKLKAFDKEKRAEQALHKQSLKTNFDTVKEKIKEYSQAIDSKQIGPQEAQKQFEEISQFMRSTELGREDVRTLKEELSLAYQPVKQRLLNEEKKRRDAELELEQHRQKQIQEIEETALTLQESMDALDPEKVSQDLAGIQIKIEEVRVNAEEKEGLLRTLLPIRDWLMHQEAKLLLGLQKDQPERRAKLQAQLKKMIALRSEIKESIEKYRKALGSSGLDFEQSFYCNDLLNAEKKRFEKLHDVIDQVEKALMQTSG